MKTEISVIIISKNNENLIGDCLESVTWADEIIIVDNGSTDKTLEIAKSFGSNIIEVKGGNYSIWRNAGAKKASSNWLLYVDTDERVTSELKKEIQLIINPQPLAIGQYVAYAIPRKNNLLGHEMKYGGWWPDYVLRLIKKEVLIRWEGVLHEQPAIKGLPAGRQGKVGKLKNPLIHISHRSLTEMIDKTNTWSEVEAQLLYKSKHPQMTWWRFFSVAAREFWYRAILKLGFLDGPIGIIEIIYQMYSRMITYAKLWELQINNKR